MKLLIMMKFLLIFILIFVNCEVKNNPLRPNGPFGLFTFYYNLSKIGNWSYREPNPSYYIGGKITDNYPLISSSAIIKNYSTKGTLPEGLIFDSTNAVISGTPSAEQNETEYIVYANNDFFKETYFATVKISVGGFSYVPATYTFNINSEVNIPAPVFSAVNPPTVTSYSISPALPTGLSFSNTTGFISGSTTNASPSTVYTVNALNGSSIIASTTLTLRFTQWINEAYLKAPNAEGTEQFGSSVSVSGDTIIVGSTIEASNQTTITNGTLSSSNNLANSSGAVYVFKRTGSTWANEAYIKAPNADVNDGFGVSAGIDGDTIVVGSNGEDSTQTTITNGTLNQVSDSAVIDIGAAYVFKRTGSTWANEAYLKAPNAETGDFFGYSVSISGDTIVVGAYNEDSNQTTITNGTLSSSNNLASASGAAYVFRRSGTTWTNEAYLKAPNAGGGDQFGTSVFIDNDTIVVGSPQESSNQTTITNGTTASSNNSLGNCGAAYVFRRNGSTWSSEAYIKAPNAETGEFFGNSVSISGETILVGAFNEDSSQTTITNGTTASSDNSTVNSGAAYVFRRNGSIWSSEAYLKAPNPDTGDNFGQKGISISGDTIVVGASQEDSNQTTITNGSTASSINIPDTTNGNHGAVYVFKRYGTIWTNEAYLKAPNAEAGDNFGSSVSISEDTIVVVAPQEDSIQTTITNGTTNATNGASNSGAAYVFRRVSQ
jgi:hypothetical protein